MHSLGNQELQTNFIDPSSRHWYRKVSTCQWHSRLDVQEATKLHYRRRILRSHASASRHSFGAPIRKKPNAGRAYPPLTLDVPDSRRARRVFLRWGEQIGRSSQHLLMFIQHVTFSVLAEGKASVSLFAPAFLSGLLLVSEVVSFIYLDRARAQANVISAHCTRHSSASTARDCCGCACTRTCSHTTCRSCCLGGSSRSSLNQRGYSPVSTRSTSSTYGVRVLCVVSSPKHCPHDVGTSSVSHL
jgi:hypothetical protein